MDQRGSVRRKKGKIKGQFVPLRYEMIKGPLFSEGYLKPIDLFFYTKIMAQKTGDPKFDSKLYYTHSLASKFASSSTYSMSKFRLWAFRCLEVVEWGRKNQTPTKFKESNGWRTLVRQRRKLNRINTLVKRYERVFNFHPKNSPKRNKEERSDKKRFLYRMIKEGIVHVI